MLKLAPHVLLVAFVISPPSLAETASDFRSYPVAVLKNVRAKPRFASPDHWTYRTQLRHGMSRGVNFAGHFTLVDVPCGMGCTMGWMVDRRTGRITELPIVGEEFPFLIYDKRANSSLLKAEWAISADNLAAQGCMRVDFVWRGRMFQRCGPARKTACALDERNPG